MNKCLLFIFLFVFYSIGSMAQSNETSQLKKDSLIKLQLNHIDSTSQRINSKIDATQDKVNAFLNPNLSEVAQKHRNKRKVATNSSRAVHALDSMKGNLTQKIDSLKKRNLPTDKYTHKLDSISTLSPDMYLQKVNERAEKLEDKLNKPVDDAAKNINDKLGKIAKEGGEKSNIPGSVAVPGTNLKGDATAKLKDAAKTDLPGTDALKSANPLNKVDNPLQSELDKVKEIKSQATNLKQAPQTQIDKLKSNEEVKNLTDKAGEVNAITDEAQVYQGDAQKLAEGKVDELKEAPKQLEKRAGEMAGLGELEKQTGEMDKFKALTDETKAKAMLKQQFNGAAKNHFEGKEKELQIVIDKVTKLKSKYDELTFINDSLKRKRVSLRGKPLRERIAVGLTLQIQKSAQTDIDYNPWIGYRIHRRLTAGVGWNERFGIGKKFAFTQSNRIYGPRVFVDLVIKKGYSVRTDIERMNTWVPPIFNPHAAEGDRMWVWGVFVGFKKIYHISGRVMGNFQFMYNIYDDHNRSPYGDKLNVRCGIEMNLKKRK